MGVRKESISKFLIGNRFHVKLRIRSPYLNIIFLVGNRFHVKLRILSPYSNRRISRFSHGGRDCNLRDRDLVKNSRDRDLAKNPKYQYLNARDRD